MDELTSGAERHIVKIEQQVEDAFKDLKKLYKDRISPDGCAHVR